VSKVAGSCNVSRILRELGLLVGRFGVRVAPNRKDHVVVVVAVFVAADQLYQTTKACDYSVLDTYLSNFEHALRPTLTKSTIPKHLLLVENWLLDPIILGQERET
jgi:hypothetical protein